MKPQDCPRFRPNLQRFADGELGVETAREMRAHLLDCLDCRAIVGGTISLRKFFRDETAPAVPAGFATRVALRAFAEGPRSLEERTVLPFARRVAALAAAAVLVAGATLLFQSGAGPREGFEVQAGSPGQAGAALEKFRKSRMKENARDLAPKTESSKPETR